MKIPLRYRVLKFLIGIRDWILAQFVFLLLKLLGLIPINTTARILEGFARWLGPKLKRHKVVMSNLEIAFPEKSIEERQQIASDSWAQIARTLLEYGYLNDILDHEISVNGSDSIEIVNGEQFLKLRDDGLPAILFTGHIANFELLAMIAGKFDLEIQSLYRKPNNKHVASHVADARKEIGRNLVASGRGSSFQLMSALGRGDHVGLLVDQKFREGIQVPFFGKDAPTNPLLAKLARRYNCPVHGARTIRLPNGRFRLEITDEIILPRDDSGDIDIQRSTELIASIVEGWVREYPEQWLWMHRRWG